MEKNDKCPNMVASQDKGKEQEHLKREKLNKKGFILSLLVSLRKKASKKRKRK